MKYIILVTLFLISTASYSSSENLDSIKSEIKKVEQYLVDNGSDIDLEQLLADLKRKESKLTKVKKNTGKNKFKNSKVAEIKRKRKWELLKRKQSEEANRNKEDLLTREPANKTAPEKREESPLKVGVMLDTYYMYNLNSPTGGSQTVLRNYDQTHNDVSLNLLELNFQGSYENVGYYVDLDFGSFADQNSSHSGDGIGQAYLTYDLNGYLISAGKMYTNVGYEVAKSQDNWNYSRSFAFSLGGPFWHEGASITKSYDSGFGWGFFLYDDWDARAETNDEKTYSAQLNYKNDNISLIYNYITGKQNPQGTLDASGNSIEHSSKFVHELNIQWDLNDNLSFAFNGLTGTDQDSSGSLGSIKDGEWNAMVAYAHWKFNSFSLTPRFEVFNYVNSVPTAQDGSTLTSDKLKLTAATLTGAYYLNQKSELRFEVRADKADQPFYLKEGSLVNEQTTLSLSWLFRM